MRIGGGEGTRTHDPLVANQVLYQLSYAPVFGLTSPSRAGSKNRLPSERRAPGHHARWCAYLDLNQRPPAYQAGALTN